MTGDIWPPPPENADTPHLRETGRRPSRAGFASLVVSTIGLLLFFAVFAWDFWCVMSNTPMPTQTVGDIAVFGAVFCLVGALAGVFGLRTKAGKIGFAAGAFGLILVVFLYLLGRHSQMH